ncbi:hypothetical protein VST04_22645 [Bacillus paranthracis]|uniref:hypothetical protein n=1 Tax=Bacillus paranthracis TaxID=2026186 RepID=UPI002DD42CEC|nr:hypothetical protein [Bacillus paranthracis]MEC4620895.1 hypothetical protein [Bacillus paranthracis]
MTTQQFAQPQYGQQFGQQPQFGQQQQKQSDPFWYRQNSSYLYGVTNAPSNMQLGIENISLKPASANQVPHGIMFNGLLRSVIGSISFQVRMSPRTQAPFVQTISTENGVDTQTGQKNYWEHINLTPQVKAQILRFAEAMLTGQAPMQQQMPQQQFGMQQPQQQFGMPMQQPMNQGMYGMPMQQQFGMQPQQQMPMQQQPMQFPQFGQQAPAYTPPAPQNMEQQPVQPEQPAEQQPVETGDKVEPQIKEDDLPI